jgi:acetyl esterase
MPLDPQAAALLATMPEHVDARSMTAAQHREAYEQVVQLRRGQGWAPEPVASSVDVDVQGVPCRLHRPEGVERPPVLVYLHGGGWVVGGIDSHEAVARSLCARAGIAVLAVEYRLAPEHPFPAPLEDCLTAARWASEQDFASVSVGGDSAGGNLAAAVALVFRVEGRALACQLLVYPALDAGASSPSYDSNAHGFGLETDDMRWYWEQYAGCHPQDDPLLSPCAATDLAGLAPAIVATAEYDVLRDEGDRYAERLRDAGVPVWHRCYPGLTHGFYGQSEMVPAADLAFTEIAQAVRDLLTS